MDSVAESPAAGNARSHIEMLARVVLLEDQVAKIDRFKRDTTVAVCVFGALSDAFFGWQWQRVGNEVNSRISESGLIEARDKVSKTLVEVEVSAKRLNTIAATAEGFDIPNRVVTFTMSEAEIRKKLDMQIFLRSPRQHHAYSDYDDGVAFRYEVLPSK